MILALFVSRTSLILFNIKFASHGPTLETDSTVAANKAVSFLVKEDGI